jgi:polysaccharide chain length determinant protein (PEP-CTERM system associated)
MIANRALELDDYLAMLRRRLKLILIPALLALLAGFLISFAFSPRYTSRSLVLVERQTVPAGYVRPIVTASVRDRVITLQQQVLSRNQLQALVNRLGLARKGENADEVIAKIQNNVSIAEADPLGSSSSGPAMRSGDAPGFYISFTADNLSDAQQICRELTSMLLAENLKSREQVAESTTGFLSRQLSEAKNNLDEQDRKFAAFKAQYMGQLPGDVDSNLKILGGLNSQFDADTQTLNRVQQDKSYAESLLAQRLAAWKSSQTFLTSETIEQRLAALQTQLVAMQTQYTDDHPELIKLKRDIAALEAKQKELTALSDEKAASDDNAGVDVHIKEPPEIRGLRQQIHQSDGVIARVTREQKQLQETINKYQSRLTLSPKVEEEYKQLTRDNEAAHEMYNSLLLNKNQSEIQTDLEHQRQGETMRMIDDANLPVSPSFPIRWRFAACGLGAGLAFGLSIAMWLEFRDKAVRDEADVLAGLDLPTLSSIPWVGPVAIARNNGFRGQVRALLGQKRTAEV